MSIFFLGDLTEDQKKIFKANQFYRGLTIPEPQEMVCQIHFRLLLMLFHNNPVEVQAEQFLLRKGLQM